MLFDILAIRRMYLRANVMGAVQVVAISFPTCLCAMPSVELLNQALYFMQSHHVCRSLAPFLDHNKLNPLHQHNDDVV